MWALITLFIVAHQGAVYLRNRRFDPFDIRTLIDLFLLVIWGYAPLVDSSLRARFDRDLLFSFTTLLGIASLYAGLHLSTAGRIDAPAGNVDTSRLGWKIQWLALLVFSTTCAVIGYERSRIAGIGFVDYSLGPRIPVHAQLLLEDYRGSVANAIVVLARPLVLLLLAVCLHRRRWVHSVLIWSTLVVGMWLISSVRLPLIVLLFMPVFFYYRRRGRRIPIWLGSLLGIVFLVLLNVLNVWRSAGLPSLNESSGSVSAAVSALAAQFNPVRGYEMLWDAEMRGELQHEYGLTYLYVAVTAIPRPLWPEKPLVAHESRWTANLFGSQFATDPDAYGVWTFTAWGEGLTQFGVVGVFVNLFIYGWLISWVRFRFGRSPGLSLVYFYYSVLAATFLRASVSALMWETLTSFLPVMLFCRWFMPLRQRADVAAAVFAVKHLAQTGNRDRLLVQGS